MRSLADVVAAHACSASTFRSRHLRCNPARHANFDAKNAKVVTTGTKVTLRGPVKTDQERTTIEQLARKTAGT